MIWPQFKIKWRRRPRIRELQSDMQVMSTRLQEGGREGRREKEGKEGDRGREG